MKVTIYTDGSARSNPNGPGGYGTIIHYTDPKGELHVREYSAGYVKTTNNRMELMAAIVGLEALTKPCDVEIISDSQYLCKTFNEHWMDGWLKKNFKGVKNVDLWKRMLEAKKQHNVTFTWVKGHAGHPENERCDELATMAADNNPTLIDEGVDLN